MKFNSLSSSNVQIGRPQNKKCGSAISGDHSVLAGGFLPYQNLTNAGCHMIYSGQHIGCRADKDIEAIDKCIIFKRYAKITHLSTAQQYHYKVMR